MEPNEIKDNEIIKASVCKCCGRVGFARTCYPNRKEFGSTDFSPLPGWSSYFGSWTLCPECSKDFDDVLKAFIATKQSPPSHGIEVKEDGYRP